MIDYVSILLSAAFGILGTIVGAAITWWTTERARKTELTYQMYSEFNSGTLLTSRHAAQEIAAVFREEPHKILDRKFGKMTVEERFHLWNVINFFQRLYVAIDQKQCNTKVIPGLFGESFYWWYIHCYENQLVPNKEREAGRRIFELKQWFERNASRQDIARWISRANNTARPDTGVRNQPQNPGI